MEIEENTEQPVAPRATGQHLTPEAIVAEFPTYEDYLDSQITSTDLFYLEDKDLARQLVELGYRGTGEPLSKEGFQFHKSRQQGENRATNTGGIDQGLVPRKVGIPANLKALTPFQLLLQELTPLNQQASHATIIYIRTFSNYSLVHGLKGQKQEKQTIKKVNPERSGYIDLHHRITTDASYPNYLSGTSKMVPRQGDLSYFHWETNQASTFDTVNYQVLFTDVHDGDELNESQNQPASSPFGVEDQVSGLVFKCKRDRKVVRVDPWKDFGDNTKRTIVESPEYDQIVVYDHLIRRKS